MKKEETEAQRWRFMYAMEEVLKKYKNCQVERNDKFYISIAKEAFTKIFNDLPNFGNAVVSGRSELLFAFRDYWRKSCHQNIEDAIKGFMRTKKGKQ